MLAKERYQLILRQLNNSGAVTTPELARVLGVSIETVRRDLLYLERLGQLQRVHGGAVANGIMQPYADLPHRLEANPAGKTELCHTASLLVEDGDIIFIDSGSTAVFFAQSLLSRSICLTVVTHSSDVFDILSQNDRFRLILCGGFYDPAEKAFYGHLTLDTLKHLHVKKAFLFPTAISLKTGICDYNDSLIQVQSHAMASSEKIFFLADSEKFEKSAMLKLCDTSGTYTYITDSQLPQHYKHIYEEQGITVITSPEDITSGKDLSNESR